MLTESSRVFLRLSGLTLLAAAVYGPLSHDAGGAALLLFVAVVSGAGGALLTGRRETPVVVGGPAAPEPEPAALEAPPGSGGGAAVAAAAAALVLVGLVLNTIVVIAGLILAAVAILWWGADAAGSHRGRPVNLLPLAVPVLALFAIGALVFFMSRILLAVPEVASTIIALTAALAILLGGWLISSRPRMRTGTLVALLAVVGVMLVAGGVVAAAIGERPEETKKGAEAAGPAPVVLVAKNIAFDKKTISFKADAPAVIRFVNNDVGTPHNVAIYRSSDLTDLIFKGDIIVGKLDREYRFTAPGAGTYFFHCDVHPNMSGSVNVG